MFYYVSSKARILLTQKARKYECIPKSEIFTQTISGDGQTKEKNAMSTGFQLSIG